VSANVRIVSCCDHFWISADSPCFAAFRDSFANVVDLLDDMFERAAQLDEPPEMNFIRKHSLELAEDGVKERTAARLFSNP
jgi:cobalamin biosynthesis Mg chelatase CobN